MAADPAFYASLTNIAKLDGLDWLPEGDRLRVASYSLYYQLYWNAPDTLKVVRRGDQENPLYLPSGRIMCNTINRYVAPEYRAVPDPRLGTNQVARDNMAAAFSTLFKRERFYSSFLGNKLSAIIKADGCWYITADPDKPQGKRISLRPLDPAQYFPISDPSDDSRIVGCDILEKIQINEDTTGIKRQRYLKPGVDPALDPDDEFPGEANPSSEFISVEVATFDLEDYGTEDQKVITRDDDQPLTVLNGITNLPVYHWRNLEEPDNAFGSSEMRGLETIIGGMDQGITDQELALALNGLGVYWTNSGSPVDANGAEVEWEISPGTVIEVGPDKTFGRVSGVTNLPHLEHINFLRDQIDRVNGGGDVAQGRVDVSVAESGIALKLRLAPILGAAGEKSTWLTDVHDQMLFDLKEWLKTYEGVNFGDEVMVSETGPQLPENKEKRFDQLVQMYTATPPLISAAYFRSEANAMGFAIPDDVQETIIEENAAFGAAADPDGARLEEEAGAPDSGVPGVE